MGLRPRALHLFSIALALGCGRLAYDPPPPTDAGAIDAARPGADGGAADAGGTPDAGPPADAGDPPADAGDPLAAASDEFEGPLDPRWRVVHPDVGTAVTRDGALVVTVLQPGLWFESDRGAAIVTDVSGDFVVSALIEIVEAATGGPPVGPSLELGGVFARDPALPDATPSHVWCGVGAESSAPVRESKSTVAAVSEFQQESFPETRGATRLCRVGDRVLTYTRAYDGGAWVFHQEYTRADLPAALEVGVLASEGDHPASIEVHVEWITFTRPRSVDDCILP